MRKVILILFVLISFVSKSQTLLTEANNFHVKTIEGTPIYLFPLLDEDNYIVVIDFFSTTCGPCQDYADDFQQSYIDFGENTGNVYFMGINWGNDNEGVHEFDSIFGLTYPTASGVQGGGNIVFLDYQVQSYPSVVVIKPNHEISNQYVWEPSTENINQAVIEAGGLLVGQDEIPTETLSIYPNPATDKTKIDFISREVKETYIDIINTNGQIVYQEVVLNHNKKSMTIGLENFERGIYFVRMITSDGKMKTEKLIVAR